MLFYCFYFNFVRIFLLVKNNIYYSIHAFIYPFDVIKLCFHEFNDLAPY